VVENIPWMECDKKFKFKNYLKFTYEMTAAVGEDNGNDNACIWLFTDTLS
jgi:hypothetical protein